MVSPTDNYTLLACESFDYWDTIVPGFWSASFAGSGPSHTSAGAGRAGTRAGYWHPAPFGQPEWSLRRTVTLPSGTTWLTSGLMVAFSSNPTGDPYLMSHNVTTGFFGLVIGTGGRLELWDNLNFSTGSRILVDTSAAGVLTNSGAFSRVELYTHRSSSSGAGDGVYEVSVNGTVVMSGTYEIWFTTASAIWYGIGDHNTALFTTDLYIDDIYSIAGDDTVTVRTLGTWQVDCRFPSTVAATLSGGFTAVGDSTTPLCIDDPTPDDNSTYAQGAVPRGEDYTLTPQPATPGTNYAVKSVARIAFTSAGDSVSPSIRLQNASAPWFQGNTLYSGSSFTAYTWFLQLYQTRPGGTPFDSSDIANLWPGVRYGSGSSPAMKLTQLVVEVASWGVGVLPQSRAYLIGV